MELFGYDTVPTEESPTLRSLGEVTIGVREVSELRQIASFILYAADRFEAHDVHGHDHFRDWSDDWSKGDADLIVARLE